MNINLIDSTTSISASNNSASQHPDPFFSSESSPVSIASTLVLSDNIINSNQNSISQSDSSDSLCVNFPSQINESPIVVAISSNNSPSPLQNHSPKNQSPEKLSLISSSSSTQNPSSDNLLLNLSSSSLQVHPPSSISNTSTIDEVLSADTSHMADNNSL